MKNFLIPLIITTSLLTLRITAQSKWTTIAPYPLRFRAIASAVVGDKIIFWCGENVTFSTSDSGNNLIEFPPNTPVNNYLMGNACGLAFADSLHGTIVSVDKEYRTTDGGLSWIQVSPGNEWINMEIVCYGSSGVGWKFGSGSYKTIDAGATWKYFDVPFMNSGIYACAGALGTDKLWVLKSSYNASYDAGAIWYSYNGGGYWMKLNTGLTSDSLYQVMYSDFKMTSSGIGFATGRVYMPANDSNFAFIQKTTDFGNTWTTTKLPALFLTNLIQVNDSTWITFGNGIGHLSSAIYQIRTIDTGKTWTMNFVQQNLGSNYCYSSVYSPKWNLVFISTVSGLFESQDQGLTYTRLTSGRDFVIVNLGVEKHPIDASRQIIAALSNTHSYLISTDAGNSWQTKEFPYTYLSNFSQINIADGTIYLIPDQNTLYKSTDEGDTWKNIYAPSQGAIRAMDVLNKNTIFIEGYPWTLFSTNGGDTWIKSPFPTTKWLNVSKITESNNISSVGGFYGSHGTNGIIYHSTDSGRDWRVIETPGEMKFLDFASDKFGIAVSNFYVYNTTDGGNTWNIKMQSNDFQSQYSAIAFNDSLYGLLRINGAFLESFDGGINWRNAYIQSPSTGYLEKLAFGSNGNIYAVGSGSFYMYSTGNISQSSNPINSDSTKDTNSIFIRNYPNPFNPTTTIEFRLPYASQVSLKVYNTLGQLVETLFNRQFTKGNHKYIWNAESYTSGIYFLHLEADGLVQTVKALLLK